MAKRGWVYVMTNRPFGTLDVGVTSDLATRVHQHRTGSGSDFCQEHGLSKLVHAEEFATMIEAIAREKAMKAWKRRWKTDLNRAEQSRLGGFVRDALAG